MTYWIWLSLSIVAAAVTMVPAVVILASLYTLGLAFPVFVVAANLWWVLILLGPVVYFGRAGKVAWGIAGSLALAAAVTGVFYALRADALQRIAAPETLSSPGALVGKAALTVEISDDGNRSTQDEPCDVLCEGLLTAGADWVRVVGWGPKGEPEDHLFRRGEVQECRTLDPAFPENAPCILLGRDDGRVADLSVRVGFTGDGHVAREEMRGLAFVFFSGESLPQDRALMLSILEQGDETLAPGLVRQVQRWMKGLLDGQMAVPADRPILMQLPRRLPPYAPGLPRLMTQAPMLFVESVEDFYRMVREGNESESQSAAGALLSRGRTDPPGAHADEAADYLAALESRRHWGYLIQIVGRYGFDPTPILQREIDSPRDPNDGPDVALLLAAACYSDPKWAATLGPFVYGLALPLTHPTVDLSRARERLAQVTGTLMTLGRSDLAADLRNRIDAETLAAEYESNFTSARPPRTPDELRDVFFGRMEVPDRCQ